MLERISEQLCQIEAVIEILKDARPLCEDPSTAGLVESALDGAETLQHMMIEAGWPAFPADIPSREHALPAPADEAMPAVDFAELCFPV
jgi:hypothetical protein